MNPLTWLTEKRRVNDLIPFEGNPRYLTEQQKEDLQRSIEKFNLVEIPAINTDNTIIAGHQRVKILSLLGRGDEVIDVRVPDRLLTAEELAEYCVRSNKNVGSWDWDALANFDDDILKMVGFDSAELDKIFQLDNDPDEDDVPEAPAVPVSKLGDIYQLGDHRVMCGDSTKREDVERLMDGKKAHLVHTDPPYNVDYGASKNPRHKIRSIQNDNMDADSWEAFCKGLYANLKEFSVGDIYMWGASGPEGMKMRLWLTEVGCHWSATIVWKKQQLVLSPANYQRMYEPCFYGWFDKSSFVADRKQTEVWEIDRPHDSKLHPTMKPVELCEQAIVNSSVRGNIVLDLFLGSGSTLIAAEKTARICYGMELDPKYVDVIIQRWETLTGKKAVKVEN